MDKKEAQYFFSPSTSSLLRSTMASLGVTDVLAVGCPSVVEHLPPATSSLLLDLDFRFQAFHPPSAFLWYNMFNGHSFHGDSTVLRDFIISASKLLIMVDPPFGAKAELVWRAVQRFREQVEALNISASVWVVWVFPYFMERQVAAASGLAMADYRVTYSNHKDFGEEGGRKQGSAVRLFTDIPLRWDPSPCTPD